MAGQWRRKYTRRETGRVSILPSFSNSTSRRSTSQWSSENVQRRIGSQAKTRTSSVQRSRLLWPLWTRLFHKLWRIFSRYVKLSFRSELWKTFVNKVGFSKQPRLQAEIGICSVQWSRTSSTDKTDPQERIPGRMGMPIGVIEVPKISCQESVEIVNTTPQERSSERMGKQSRVIEVPKISCYPRNLKPRPDLAAYSGAESR